MRRYFSFRSWSLASLFSSTAIAVTLFGVANAGAAIVMSVNSDCPADSTGSLGN